MEEVVQEHEYPVWYFDQHTSAYWYYDSYAHAYHLYQATPSSPSPPPLQQQPESATTVAASWPLQAEADAEAIAAAAASWPSWHFDEGRSVYWYLCTSLLAYFIHPLHAPPGMQECSPSSPAGPRLWRPAAQRSLRNSWSSISRHLTSWAASSSHGLSAASSLVNALLSQRYVEFTDFGVLKAMKGIEAKACEKFFYQGEASCTELLTSYQDLVENLSAMLKAKGTMRAYLKGPTTGNLVEFSDQQHLNQDTGDGDGLAVFSALSVSTHEMLAQELIDMFVAEIKIKWLIISELHTLFYSGLEDDYPKKLASKDLIRNVYAETTSKLPGIFNREQEYDALVSTQQGSGAKVKREVLQVYLTAWLAEVNIRKSRKAEILRMASEEVQCTLQG